MRHSGASSLTIEVNVADELVVNVLDDGRGIPADNQRRSGLENMSRRAQQLGGTCEFLTPASGGTHVCWTVPLELES
ncbi:GAF domain-containing sensor histidine kinase [Mycolicibacterium aubagnense]